MITYQDQENLFNLIARTIPGDVTCYAFGGNAMMFYGYKEDTKDVDVLFEQEEERAEFIRALENIGYRETSLLKIYVPEKLRDPHAPKVYQLGDGRFDLFVTKIFKTLLSPKMKEDLFAVHQFKGKQTITVKVLRTEFIVLLKAVTSRDKDFEDILTIVRKTKNFDWQYLLDEVIWQYQHGDSWVLLDVEKKMRDLQQQNIFIEEKYVQQLYEAQGKAEKEKADKRKVQKGEGKKN